MTIHPLRFVLAIACACANQGAATAAPAQVIDIASITPKCEEPFRINADASGCDADPSAFSKIKAKEACDGIAGAVWKDNACTAGDDPAKLPRPSCGTALPDLSYSAEKRACQVVRDVPRSATGDYVGDCFRIISAPPDGLDINLPADTFWSVVSQARLGSDDQELVVAPANPVGLGLTVGCAHRQGAKAQRVKASSLIAYGAHRYGWAYGVLAMPFKYFPHDKSFATNALSIGPFLGRRWGSSGSAVTAAVAATLGSVRAESRDAQGLVTGTHDVTAFSAALGLMLDVSKNPELKPFKVGFFIGKDIVSQDATVTYKQNRQKWLAFQIGFDFTDTK